LWQRRNAVALVQFLEMWSADSRQLKQRPVEPEWQPARGWPSAVEAGGRRPAAYLPTLAIGAILFTSMGTPQHVCGTFGVGQNNNNRSFNIDVTCDINTLKLSSN
jgi:hypothetical protein